MVEQKVKTILELEKSSCTGWICVVLHRFFRRFNAVSAFDAYPMPQVDALLDVIGEAQLLSNIDLTKGYWQSPLASEAKEKIIFCNTLRDLALS